MIPSLCSSRDPILGVPDFVRIPLISDVLSLSLLPRTNTLVEGMKGWLLMHAVYEDSILLTSSLSQAGFGTSKSLLVIAGFILPLASSALTIRTDPIFEAMCKGVSPCLFCALGLHGCESRRKLTAALFW